MENIGEKEGVALNLIWRGALEKAGWRKWGWGGEMKSDMQTKHGGTKNVSLTGTG